MDLPWQGYPVRLELTVRRFRCVNPDCKRATFAEDCGPNLPRYARRTLEAKAQLLAIALTAGGEAGARLAGKQGLSTSPDTLLRLIRRMSLPAASTPRVLGIDDLALRRGHDYATIFVNMETHRPVDLVEGREADMLANWLKAHPGVEVISRDRADAYAEGAKVGAPQAIQVADRFHLLQNASTALDELLRSRRRQTEYNVHYDVAEQVTDAEGGTAEHPQNPSPPLALSATKQAEVARRAARVARWEKVKEMREAGRSIREIARALGMNRRTVRHYLATPKAPRNQVHHPRPGGLKSPSLQPFVGYLQDRWQAGCHNVSQLYREIVGRGYAGSRSLVAQSLQPWRPPRLSAKQRRLTRRLSLRWLCLRPPERLKPDEKTALADFLARDNVLATGYDLLQQFRQVLAIRTIAALDKWLDTAKASELPSFVALANGIAEDRSAVNAALLLPWSNGTTEGHINRVKLIKRQGYGRAKFDLLRQRVLAA
jgi:transposase